MWLLFIPAFGIGIVLLFEPTPEPRTAIASALCAFALSGAVLYRVTANFIRARKKAAAQTHLEP